MQDDLTDGVEQLVSTGRVVADRVCIMGASYGGYAALMASVREPKRFKCAVAIAPVTDLVAQIDEYQARGNRRGHAEWRYMVGDPADAENTLRSQSPLFRAAELTVPILLLHGAIDQTVDPVHSRRLKTQLDKLGRLSRLELLPQAGHAFAQARNRVTVYQLAAEFLFQNLQTTPAN